MADVALVIGHHPDAPGAPLTLGDMTVHEYDLWKPFARELSRTLAADGVIADVIERPNQDPDKELADRINATSAECAIELHFNGAEGPARGTEMLYWEGSEDGRRLATMLHDQAASALNTKDRGLRPKSSGWPFLRLTEMPAVIAEPAFGTTRSDAWFLLTRQCDLMQGYRRAILDYLSRDAA